MLRVEGPVVSQLQSIFLEDWLHTTGEVLNGDEQFPRSASAGEVQAQAVAASRTDQSSMAKLLYYMAIQAARRRILDRERLLRAGPPDPAGARRTRWRAAST